MAFQEAFMEALKARYVQVAGDRKFGDSASKTQAPYYLARVQDNLVMPMSERHVAEYNRGSGGELEGKMKALRSSSAMTFNLLGNGPVQLNGANGLPAGAYEVEFEHQLPTLAGNPHPANLDARLEPPDRATAIYCEMKLAEWILNKASGLRAQYLESASYLIPDKPATAFREAFESLCAPESDRAGRIAPRLDRYDAFQMLKHLLAIYSEFHRRAEADEAIPQSAMLLNCVWEMAHPEKLGNYDAKYRALEAEEHEQFADFCEAVEPVVGLFDELGVRFAIRYLSFADMLGGLELEGGHRDALERYVV